MMPTFSDYRERRQIIRQTYPDDLLEDLQDSEPELYQEALMCDYHLAALKPALEDSVSPIALLPSLLTAGWDKPKKHKNGKNWADMENLLKLYAIGLYFKNKPKTYQAEHDIQELKAATLKASISPHHKKGIPAEKRLQNAKTYLYFGMRNLDAFFLTDPIQKAQEFYYLDQEIYDTRNEHNAIKLQKSQDIAKRVGHTICERYKTK